MTIPHRFDRATVERYVASGAWAPETDYLREQRERVPERVAIVDRDRSVTYGEYDRLVDRLAVGLVEAGAASRDTVVFQVPNWLEHYLLLHATRRAGLRSIGVDMNLRGQDLSRVLEVTDAGWLVVVQRFRRHDFLEMALALREQRPGLRIAIAGPTDEAARAAGYLALDDVLTTPDADARAEALLAPRAFRPDEVNGFKLTSGSTGRPKLAMQLGYQAVQRQAALVERYRLTADDVFLIMGPLSGGAGRVLGIWSAHPLGARTVLLDSFDPGEALRLIERERVTVTSGVPTQYIKLLEAPGWAQRDLSSLRAIFYTGARMPAEIGRRYVQDLGVALLGVYGCQDAAIFAATSVDDSLGTVLSSVGRPFPDIHPRVVAEDGTTLPPGQDGELHFGGPGVLLAGYYRDAEATRRAFDREGYFATGDVGHLDAAGNVVVQGRRVETINRGGYKIYPAELEELLLAHPKVRQVAVVRCPDRVFGERACAFVVPRGDAPTLEELVGFLTDQGLTRFKLPEVLRLLPELPQVGDTQKIDRKALETLARASAEVGAEANIGA